MKILLLMADDGISSLVWLEMAKQYLKSGRKVLAITDNGAYCDVIGTGDGLPTFAFGLKGHPSFVTRSVGVDGGELLLKELQSLPDDTVVMFNMSLVELAAQDAQWLAVLEGCAGLPNEIVFSHYYPHTYWVPELNQMVRESQGDIVSLKRVPWDYVAGGRILGEGNLEGMRQCFPSLAHAIEMPDTRRLPGGAEVSTWQVINHSGAYEMRLPTSQVRDKTDAYPCLWDARYPHVTLGQAD